MRSAIRLRPPWSPNGKASFCRKPRRRSTRSRSTRRCRLRTLEATMKPAFMKLLAACLLATVAGAAGAQADPPALVQVSGTLQKARSTGALTIGYRESSIPFSYLSARGEPIGYSIELCRKLVDAIGEAVGREVAIKWLPVTSESRIDAVASGRAD